MCRGSSSLIFLVNSFGAFLKLAAGNVYIMLSEVPLVTVARVFPFSAAGSGGVLKQLSKRSRWLLAENGGSRVGFRSYAPRPAYGYSAGKS